MQRPSDPRKAKTLDEACANSSGTYNGVRLLSWLSEVLHPGAGLSEEEVREIASEVKAEHEAGR